jgi:Zn-dependent protease
LQSIDITQALIAFVVLLVSLTVHEAAHAWTADRLGDPTARLLGRVSLNPAVHADLIGTVLFPIIALLTNVPLIGWAKPVPVNTRRLQHPRRDYMLVAAAGPASNIAIAIVVSVLAAFLAFDLRAAFTGVDGSSSIEGVLALFVVLNVFLAVFNMIPVPPLDGGNVLGGLLPYHLAVQFNRLRPWGFLILYALILTGLLHVIVLPPAGVILSWLL